MEKMGKLKNRGKWVGTGEDPKKLKNGKSGKMGKNHSNHETPKSAKMGFLGK